MRMSPRETLENNNLCPKCGRPVTIGVMHRVEELADREDGLHPEGAASFRSLLTLSEILSQIRGVGSQTKWVQAQYRRLLEQCGPEFAILMDLPLEELDRKGHGMLVEGLRRMRKGEVHIAAGYDGEFGSITLFTQEERRTLSGQGSLIAFEVDSMSLKKRPSERPRFPRKTEEARKIRRSDSSLSRGFQPANVASSDEADPLFRGLNPDQMRAIRHGERPLLIVAGPGTGKTLTLTRRIGFLIRHGIAKPKQVLALTFTNRAAQEMQERLIALLGEEAQVTVQTFHALGYQILREQKQLSGRSGSSFIVDNIRAEGLLRAVLNGLDPSVSGRERVAILDRISRLKQNLQGPEVIETSDPGLAMVYRAYEKALERARCVDLDDLLVLPVRLFEGHREVLNDYRERFRFVSVDEYQDINYAQYRLIQLLSPHGENLCVIGDPDQAIYGFRGADNRYFLQFENDYPGAEVIRLKQNYRSSETIVRASARLMSLGSSRLENLIWSGIGGDDFLSMAEYPTDRAEAESIVQTIEQLMGGTSHFSLDSGRVDGVESPETRSFSDFAVFYRLHFQGELIEEAFQRSGIPFRRIGGEALANNEGVKGVLEVLRSDLEAGKVPEFEKDHARLAPGLEGGESDASLAEMIRRIARELGFDPTEDALKTLVCEAGASTGDVAEFLAHMALRLDLDTFDPRAEKVTLMTLHASKGLEFPIVFVAGCEADLLPYRPEGRPPSPVEEERRLLYVGLTRGKAKIFLTRARRRTVFGRVRVQEASPFLKDIEDHLREGSVSLRKPPPEKSRKQLDLF